MEEHHDITLRQKDGPNPPDLLKELRGEIEQLGLTAPRAARKWLHGKGEEQLAKASEIRSGVLEKIKRLELDYQRLDQERQEAQDSIDAERRKDEMRHEEQTIALRTDFLRAKTEAIKEMARVLTKLREIGVDVDFTLIEKPIKSLLSEFGEETSDKG